MARKVQIGPSDQKISDSQLVSDGLRGWVERVVVPILVKEFLREKVLQKEENNG
jgi:hypothetical protein